MSGRDLDWERLARASCHPLRVSILESALDGGEVTAKGMADRLGVGVPLVSYHVRQLAEQGFLEQTGERRVRGAIQTVYRLPQV